MVCVIPDPRSDRVIASWGCRGLILVGIEVLVVEIGRPLPCPCSQRGESYVSDLATIEEEQLGWRTYLEMVTSVRARDDPLANA
jgi:hypothetical protein